MKKQHKLFIGIPTLFILLSLISANYNNSVFAQEQGCGDTYTAGSLQEANDRCNCVVDGVSKNAMEANIEDIGSAYCCGWWRLDAQSTWFCFSFEPDEEDVHPTQPVYNPPPEPEPGESLEVIPHIPEVGAEQLNKFNPLQQLSTRADYFLPGGDFSPAAFINAALNIIFPLAGLILFLMIVWGGFEMLTGVAGKKGLEAGKQRVTAAVIGFLLLFASYWIIQIIETITGVTILG